MYESWCFINSYARAELNNSSVPVGLVKSFIHRSVFHQWISICYRVPSRVKIELEKDDSSFATDPNELEERNGSHPIAYL